MGIKLWIVVMIQCTLVVPKSDASVTEPTCYSRFDYDHKVMKSLLTLETKVEHMEEVINQQKKIIDELTKEVNGKEELMMNDYLFVLF